MSDWQSLLHNSLESTRDEPESRFFQLATIDSKGMSQNRTVVCRDVFNQHDNRAQQDTVWFISDTRSAKFAELSYQPNAAVCWYFTTTREQYRLNVTAVIRTPKSDRSLCEHYWQLLSASAREQFLWGQPASPRAQPQQPLQSNVADTNEVPAHFCVVALQINEVDYLNLKGNPQQRQHFVKRNEQWHCADLIP